MPNIFKIKDKDGKEIRLTRERWKHIKTEHPEVEPYLEEIKQTIKKPTKAVKYEYDENIKHYYKHFKTGRAPENYLLVIAKHLNGEGFIITAYFTRKTR